MQNSYTKERKSLKAIYEKTSMATYMNSVFLRGVPAPFHLIKKQTKYIYL